MKLGGLLPHIIPGLSPDDASYICMNQCKAMCCKGSLILALDRKEVEAFTDNAKVLGVEALVEPATNGGGWIRFSDYPEENCPMLDNSTSACRIYDNRPQRCRSFPQELTLGCAISGG